MRCVFTVCAADIRKKLQMNKLWKHRNAKKTVRENMEKGEFVHF